MLELRPDPAELSRMRQFIRRRAKEHGLDDGEAFQAQLVATEAVTNAMRHGSAGGRRRRPCARQAWHAWCRRHCPRLARSRKTAARQAHLAGAAYRPSPRPMTTALAEPPADITEPPRRHQVSTL